MKLTILLPENTSNPIIHCDEEAQCLKDFIETELLQDIAYIDHLLDQLNKPEMGTFEILGNSYTLIVKDNKFVIENQYDDEERMTGDLPFFINTLENLRKILIGSVP